MASFITYQTLRHEAQNSKVSPLTLEHLKENFKSRIISKRRCNWIRSVEDFLDVLERLDEVSEEKLEFYNLLAQHCQLQGLKQMLSLYDHGTKFTQSIQNNYRESRLAENVHRDVRLLRNNTEHFSGVDNSSVPQRGAATKYVSCVGVLSHEKRKALYKILNEELGRDWRNLGRVLDIREGQMDNIESQSQDLSTRIAKLLEIFENNECHDPKDHFSILCRALDECQRKDLRRKFDKILSY